MGVELKAPTSEELKRLYELAVQVKELEPWQWMEESDVFGVENPETKEIGFVSTMGLLGEHTAIAVYIGAKGLYGFVDLQTEDLEIDPYALLEMPQLQVSFESREILEKRDRDEIKKLGLKFRGDGNYPLFRKMGSGYLPWFITSDEARFLTYVLEQLLIIAPRFDDDPDILNVEDDPYGDIYLVRVAEKENGDLIWRDEMKRIREPEPERISFDLPKEAIDRLKKYPRNNKMTFEIDLFRAPTPLLDNEKRPFIPQMLMIAERHSRFIIGVEFLEPAENNTKLLEAVAMSLLKIWSRHQVLPKEILVGSDLVYRLLKGFSQKLSVSLRETDDLIAINDACEDMFGSF